MSTLCDPCADELQEVENRPAYGFDDVAELEWERNFIIGFCEKNHGEDT